MKRGKPYKPENDSYVLLIKVLIRAAKMKVGLLQTHLKEYELEQLQQFRREVEEDLQTTGTEKSVR